MLSLRCCASPAGRAAWLLTPTASVVVAVACATPPCPHTWLPTPSSASAASRSLCTSPVSRRISRVLPLREGGKGHSDVAGVDSSFAKRPTYRNISGASIGKSWSPRRRRQSCDRQKSCCRRPPIPAAKALSLSKKKHMTLSSSQLAILITAPASRWISPPIPPARCTGRPAASTSGSSRWRRLAPPLCLISPSSRRSLPSLVPLWRWSCQLPPPPCHDSRSFCLGSHWQRLCPRYQRWSHRPWLKTATRTWEHHRRHLSLFVVLKRQPGRQPR